MLLFCEIQCWSKGENQAVSFFEWMLKCVFYYGFRYFSDVWMPSLLAKLAGAPRREGGVPGPCAAAAEGPRWAPGAVLLQCKCFSPAISPESADLEQKYLLLSVLLMASFCGKERPLGDCTPGCAVTCSCLAAGWGRPGRKLSLCQEWFWGKRICSLMQKVFSRAKCPRLIQFCFPEWL